MNNNLTTNLVGGEFDIGELKESCAEQIAHGVVFGIEGEDLGRGSAYREIRKVFVWRL